MKEIRIVRPHRYANYNFENPPLLEVAAERLISPLLGSGRFSRLLDAAKLSAGERVLDFGWLDLVKALVSAAVIVLATRIQEVNDRLSALIIALPLVSVLAMIWMHACLPPCPTLKAQKPPMPNSPPNLKHCARIRTRCATG